MTNHLTLDNSRVSFTSIGKTTAKSTFDAANKLAITVTLGANNTSSTTALTVSGKYNVVSGSTLSIDANGKGVGSYHILQTGAMTNPGNLTITLKDGSTQIGSTTSISAMTGTGKCLYMGVNNSKHYSLFSPDGKSVILSITPKKWTFTTITGGYQITDGNLGVGEKVDVYTSSATWPVPTGVTKVDYLVVGGGGAGGGKKDQKTYAGGGGGAGGYTYKTGQSLIAGQTTLTVTVGAGGQGNSAAVGGNGGYSQLSGALTTCMVDGGGGGGYYGGSETPPRSRGELWRSGTQRRWLSTCSPNKSVGKWTRKSWRWWRP